MRWRNYKRALLDDSAKTFLVLPLLEKSDRNTDDDMNRNSGLRLFTKTWPKKTSDLNQPPCNETETENDDQEQYQELDRPLTATLERPQILDAKFMRQIDMSLIRKEFLAITSLCRTPLNNVNNVNNRAVTTIRRPRHRTAIIERRRPLPMPVAISPTEKSKKQRKHESLSEADNTSWEDESLPSSERLYNRRATKLRPPRIRLQKSTSDTSVVAKGSSIAPTEINNNIVYVKPISTKPLQLPEPCTTCGRTNLPERFHSHPTTPLKPLKKLELKIPTKNIVQKPVAIRYKSKLENKELEMAPIDVKAKTSKGPRTLTCYICGREFGTASLPLHEPKCLERWERDNQKLPPQLRKSRPVKPDVPMTKEEWNKFAWESAQSQLIACRNCGRTFLPDRLEVHQRSCKEPQRGPTKSLSVPTIPDTSHQKNNSLPHGVPGLVPCPHCAKLFGSKSVKIHEPQCLKKLQKEKAVAVSSDERPSSTSKKPPMFPCYLCGRLFGVNSIYIHEPQCLKKWRAENDKLPADKRRPVPPKPDIKFTPDGKVDFAATEEANWQTHLEQLVPCQLCKRTFNPDRVEIHERSCKGPMTNSN